MAELQLPKTHTAVKIEPEYSGPIVHVLDASKSVSVASSLLSSDVNSRSNFILDIKSEYNRVREARAGRTSNKQYISLKEARNNKLKLDWTNYHPVKPQFLGTKVFEDYDLEELSNYIDWTPFFSSWQLAGKFPDILEDEIVGEEASKLFQDAQQMLRKIIEGKWLQAKAVIGLFPANSVNDDDIQLYKSEDRKQIVATLRNLRQQRKKAPGQPNFCLTDFIAPKENGIEDYIGAFAVTTGLGIESHVKRFEENHDDYNAIMLKALADRFAEALAERMHECIRKEIWAYATDESLDNNALIREKYRGIRPAPGYPACPEHTEKGTLWKLLDVENQVGISLTESYAMYPAASVSGWYYAHPKSKYFGLGKIDRDQLEDYANRKNMNLEEAKKWLTPNLRE